LCTQCVIEKRKQNRRISTARPTTNIVLLLHKQTINQSSQVNLPAA
jgi:hypothetical protein